MAIEESSTIRSQFKPEIKLDELSLNDLFSGTSEFIPDERKNLITGHQEQFNAGTNFPLISINNYVIKLAELAAFKIDCTGFLPILIVQFDLISTTAFTSTSMPKDGDRASVFIRAKNDTFKPIRNDYVITSVEIGKGGEEGLGGRITITGELFVPHIRDEIVKTYRGSSFEVLKKIARDLKLGFATNEVETRDEMNWVCSSDSLYNFINHVADHSWKSPKDFYKVFIDFYYHLNFINVNQQFEGDYQMPAAILDTTLGSQYYSDDKKSVDEGSMQAEVPKLLTNMTDFQNTNFFIKQHEVINESSAIAKRWGYKTHAQFFDQKSLKYWDLYVDPLTTTGSENKNIILKGRTFPKKEDSTEKGAPAAEDFWKSQNKKLWLGVQSKNVHDKYLFSEIHNKRNREEINKLYLKIDMPRWNPNVANGEKIPIVMQNIMDSSKKFLVDIETADSPPTRVFPAIDQFYTGMYMVDGIEVFFVRENPYDSFSSANPDDEKKIPEMFETIYVKRREWPAP